MNAGACFALATAVAVCIFNTPNEESAAAGTPTTYVYTWDESDEGEGNPCNETPAVDTLSFPKVSFTPSRVEVEMSIDGSHFLRGFESCWDCPSAFAPQPPFCDDATDTVTKWLADDQAVCVYTNWPRLQIAGGSCPYSPGYNTQVNSSHNVLIHRGDVSYAIADDGTYSVDGVEYAANTWRSTTQANMGSWDWDAGGFSDPTDSTTFSTTDRDIVGEFQGTGNFVMPWGVGFDQDLAWIGCTHRYTQDVNYDEVTIEIRIYP